MNSKIFLTRNLHLVKRCCNQNLIAYHSHLGLMPQKFFNIYDDRKFSSKQSVTFETVYALPYIKYLAVYNRLKIYHLVISSVAVPITGILEYTNIVSKDSCLLVLSAGFFGLVALSLSTISFRNVIGFIYVSEDNRKMKISSLDYWGKRIDRIIDVEDWIPLSDVESKLWNPFYLTAKLKDGTVYKIFLRFGKVLDHYRMGAIIE